MAGTYTDAPDHRMAYDRDGTHVLVCNVSTGAIPADYGTGSSQAETFNDDDESQIDIASLVSNGQVVALTFLFPEIRTITNYLTFVELTGSFLATAGSVEVSTDTTNGIDGTWVSLHSGNFVVAGSAYSKAQARDNIHAVTPTSAKGVRFRHEKTHGSNTIEWISVHLYGAPASDGDRLQFWLPTTDAKVGAAYFDWGDVARSSTLDRDFRIHNPSATLTANTVVVSAEALSDTSPANTGQHTFSTDGTIWASTGSLGDLAPGATSDVVTLRRSTDSGAALGLWWVRLVASASSWS